MVDTKQFVKAAEEKMTFAIEYLDEQLAHIRAGKANPKILDGVRVPYYGSLVPLTNVASVNTPDGCKDHCDHPVGKAAYQRN
jgi:ribosome recycling factor